MGRESTTRAACLATWPPAPADSVSVVAFARWVVPKSHTWPPEKRPQLWEFEAEPTDRIGSGPGGEAGRARVFSPRPDAVHITAPAGSCCLFDCRIHHCLPPNHTAGVRAMYNGALSRPVTTHTPARLTGMAFAHQCDTFRSGRRSTSCSTVARAAPASRRGPRWSARSSRRCRKPSQPSAPPRSSPCHPKYAVVVQIGCAPAVCPRAAPTAAALTPLGPG